MRQTRALFCVIRTAAFGQAAMSSTTSLDELANDWIADWRNQLETGEYGKTDANFGVDRHAREEPETAWPVNLTIRQSLDPIFSVLAPVFLENFSVVTGMHSLIE